MIVALNNFRQVQVLKFNFMNKTIDFKWIEGYSGECTCVINYEGEMPTKQEIINALNVIMTPQINNLGI